MAFDLTALVAQRQMLWDFVQEDRNELERSGEYGLVGLLDRPGHAIDSISAKRVVTSGVHAPELEAV